MPRHKGRGGEIGSERKMEILKRELRIQHPSPLAPLAPLSQVVTSRMYSSSYAARENKKEMHGISGLPYRTLKLPPLSTKMAGRSINISWIAATGRVISSLG